MSLSEIFASPEYLDVFVAGVAFVLVVLFFVSLLDLLYHFIKSRIIKSR